MFDFSNYTKDSKYYNNYNNLVVDKMKGFMWGTCKLKSKSNVGLKPNMCTFITEDNYESKKAKSINKNNVNDELNYEDYKIALFNRSYMRHEMNRIQSKDHNIGSYRINISFSLFLQ